MREQSVEPGQFYRHFKKGTLYEVICIATHSETDAEMVVYRDKETGRCFVRPLEMFIGYKEEGEKKTKRFVLVS